MEGGSKLPAITTLLESTLETRRDLFCNLISEIVRKGLIYRNNKGNTDLDKLKDALVKLNDLKPTPRGFAFEKFLQELFSLFGLAPRGSFRLVGGQIVGISNSATGQVQVRLRSTKVAGDR